MTSYDGPVEDLKHEFRSWAKKHPNFMTPKIVDLHVVPEDNVVIEVAEGLDMEHREMYGVTPWRRTSEFKFEQAGMHEHRQLFQGPGAKDEAIRFAKGLKEWFEEQIEQRSREGPFPEMERASRFAGRRPDVHVRSYRRRA